jgi:hypothetical protein
VVKVLALVLIAASLSVPATARAKSEHFDKPKDTQVVDLPADPANPQAKPKRTCTYYTDYLVKEVDLGEVGASELSIAAFHGEPPKCDKTIKHEAIIDPDIWSGYFSGAKADFVFFDAEDGWNGGMPFAVFSTTTGHKLFSDTRKGDGYNTIEAVNGGLVVHYRRVWLAPCSLMVSTKACWKKIAAATSLPEAARPDCSAAYKKEMERTPKFASDIPSLPTVISYEAEARYEGGKLNITPGPGKVECWLSD